MRGPFISKLSLLLACISLKLCTAHLFLTRADLSNGAIQLFDDICVHNAAKHEQNSPAFENSLLQTLSNLSTEFKIARNSLPGDIAQHLGISTADDDIEGLLNNLSKVQHWFQELLNILQNREGNTVSTLKDFSQATTSFTLDSLKVLVEKIHDDFFDLGSRESAISKDEIDKKSDDSIEVCSRNHSAQEVIYQLYKAVALSDLQGSLVIFQSYCMKEILYRDDYTYLKERVTEDFKHRLLKSSKQTREKSKFLSREIWRCDANDPQNGVTFSKLGPIFQAYLIRETDMVRSKFVSFFASCGSRDKERAKICKSPDCNMSRKFKTCSGYLRDCSFVDNKLEFCPSAPNSDRQYEWMKTKSGVVYGHETADCNNTQVVESRLMFDVCICNCESEDAYEDRYFSLQDATSDVHENKVITGMRFSKRKHAFFIEIQQAVLGPKGKIISLPEWKAVKSVLSFQNTNLTDEVDMIADRWARLHDNKMAYAVTYDQSTVYLDDLKIQDDKLVVTGLRLKQIDKSLGLEVRVTTFDHGLGRLDLETSKWMANTNATSKRTEFKLIKPDEPTRMTGKHYTQLSHSNQFVKFRMSDLGKDLGQNVVPFIDLQDVTTNPPSPLSGVGIILRGRENSGGFLAPKLIHYDHENYFD